MKNETQGAWLAISTNPNRELALPPWPRQLVPVTPPRGTANLNTPSLLVPPSVLSARAQLGVCNGTVVG